MLMKYDCFPRYIKSEFYNACSAQDTQESAGEDADNKDNKKRKVTNSTQLGFFTDNNLKMNTALVQHFDTGL